MTTAKPKIGIFGYYSYQNLGDNMMACMIADHVRSQGFEPVIFSKRGAELSSRGFSVRSDVEQLVADSEGVICGGGGVLIPSDGTSGRKGEFNDDLAALVATASRLGKPLFGISLGGAGQPLAKITPLARRDLIGSLRYVTLRNQEDIQLLSEAGVDGEFLHDIVWTTASRFPVEARKSSRIRVGLNLYLGGKKKFVVLKKLIKLIVQVRRDIDFVFYDIAPQPEAGFRAFQVVSDTPRCRSKRLIDLSESCAEVSSLDLLISTRLHFGVMAMSYGVPAVAFAPQKKTRLLYERIGRSEYVWDKGDIANFVRLFLFPGKLKTFLARAAKPIDPAIIASAEMNYTRLSEILGRIRQR